MSAPAATVHRPRGLAVAAVIVRRDLIRFVRQPARIVAAVGTPCVLWLFMASGFADALQPRHLADVSFAAFLLPGMMTLVAVFAAIFSSIAVIEDRNEGWLNTVIVSPAPRWSIAAGMIAGGSLLAWAQAAVLLALAPLLGMTLSVGACIEALAGLALTCCAMTAVGLIFAWRIETTGGFHAVMNLLFMPLWMLSGAMFPVQGAASWLARITAVNPLTWCTEAIRGPLLGRDATGSLLAAAAFALATLALATWTVARGGGRN